MRLWKDCNFQEKTKVGQIFGIVTTRSVSCLVYYQLEENVFSPVYGANKNKFLP